VYSPEQLPVVKDIAKLKQERGEWMDADRQQIFRLKIGERSWGRQSEQLVPLLHELGAYFAERGDEIPRHWAEDPDLLIYREELFRESIDLYERAIDIVEQKYGENDLRLVESLRGLSKARILQETGRYEAEDAMERAVEVVQMNPGTDLPDYVRTLVELGDVYTITRDGRAEETYLQAWNLIADKPEYDDLRRDLFGIPQRLMPMESKVFVLDRYPQGLDESDELYIDAEYTVHSSGKVTHVEILDGNVANQDKRIFRSILSERFYRPRIVDGKLVDTEGMMLHQTFRVRETEPETEISFDAGPEYDAVTPRFRR
ncbi:MAG: tetratricopeptide repeat protein, partial [Pseudomonadales bacterium]|nr:tetratricopeptide repeat protein [Pseudomonadales bacterium]